MENEANFMVFWIEISILALAECVYFYTINKPYIARVTKQYSIGRSMTPKKRSKLATLLLAPALAVVFAVGWALYYIGQSSNRKTQKPIKPAQLKPETVHLMAIPQEEQTITN